MLPFEAYPLSPDQLLLVLQLVCELCVQLYVTLAVSNEKNEPLTHRGLVVHTLRQPFSTSVLSMAIKTVPMSGKRQVLLYQ